MAFGLPQPAPSGDYNDFVKYDANAGRLFRMDKDATTYEQLPVDITTPAPRFAIDFGSLEVGYGFFSQGNPPDLRLVPYGQPLPEQPRDLDEKKRLKFRPTFRVKLVGKVLDGLREWTSQANCVMEAVEDLHQKFKEHPEAQAGKVPIVEMTRTLPVTLGKGKRARTIYAPCFQIIGWTERTAEMGDRVVPKPPKANGHDAPIIDDEVPF
jgi:hypothetical protein